MASQLRPGASSDSGRRGESLVDQLASGIAQAAEREADPEQKRRLLAVARGLGSGAAKTIAINVASEILEQRFPH
jgi:hypothetical protein